MASGPHNRAVSCPLCNEKFFPASLKFHKKQCEKRRGARIVNCPYCKVELSQLELPEHIGRCPKSAAGRQNAGGGGGGGGGGRSGGGGGGSGAEGGAAAAAPSRAPRQDGQYDPEVTEDGRMRCVYCGRYFNPDRIEKHQDICGALKNARPKGVDGQPTQTCRKVFNSEAQRFERGAAFMSPEQFDRKQRQKDQELERHRAAKAQTAGKWRYDHEQFQAACHAGRDDGAAAEPPPRGMARAARNVGRGPQGPPPGMVPCPHCGRHFNPDVAERHIPICAKVINRPKPPPQDPDRMMRNTSQGFREEQPPDRTMRSQTMRDANRTMRPGGPPRYESPHRRGSGGGLSSTTGRGFGGRGSDDDDDGTPGARGGGLKAARTLRASTGRLPTAGGATSRQGSRQPSRDRRAASVSRAAARDDDGSPRSPPTGRSPAREDTTDSSPRQAARAAPSLGHAVERVGLRRSALLYRLLSAVPASALERELADAGIDSDGFGQEELVETVMELLS